MASFNRRREVVRINEVPVLSMNREINWRPKQCSCCGISWGSVWSIRSDTREPTVRNTLGSCWVLVAICSFVFTLPFYLLHLLSLIYFYVSCCGEAKIQTQIQHFASEQTFHSWASSQKSIFFYSLSSFSSARGTRRSLWIIVFSEELLSWITYHNALKSLQGENQSLESLARYYGRTKKLDGWDLSIQLSCEGVSAGVLYLILIGKGKLRIWSGWFEITGSRLLPTCTRWFKIQKRSLISK